MPFLRPKASFRLLFATLAMAVGNPLSVAKAETSVVARCEAKVRRSEFPDVNDESETAPFSVISGGSVLISDAELDSAREFVANLRQAVNTTGFLRWRRPFQLTLHTPEPGVPCDADFFTVTGVARANSTPDRTLITHEVGHLIFLETLLTQPLWFISHWRDEFRRAETQARQASALLRSIWPQKQRDVDAVYDRRRAGEITEAQVSSRVWMIEHDARIAFNTARRDADEAWMRLRGFFKPNRSGFLARYEELFTDTLAFAATGVDRPGRIYHSSASGADALRMAMHSTDEREAYILGRNFDDMVAPEDWPDRPPWNAPHQFFKPVRSYIGTLFRGQTAQRRMELTALITQAMIQNLSEALGNRSLLEYRPPEGDLAEANRRLISAIQRLVRASGLQ